MTSPSDSRHRRITRGRPSASAGAPGKTPRARGSRLRPLFALFIALGLASTVTWFTMIRMPGKSHRGPLPPLTEPEAALRDELRADVHALAVRIGERHVWRPAGLASAADHVHAAFTAAGLAPARLAFSPGGHHAENIEATVPGSSNPGEIVLLGAHYDSVRGTVGANDNASGVAALLALARRFARRPAPRTLRFVAFSCEEPPWFQTYEMGSLVYARACRARGDRISAMLSLETIGCYSDRDGSQAYPFPFGLFYPSRGDFIGFVGNLANASLVRECVATFRAKTAFPSQGAALPSWIPGISWSDHWSFWEAGYPALMVTDTAPFRYAHYHLTSDTAEKLDHDRMSRVVMGIERVVAKLAGLSE